jgi:predicted nucleotidyltransferase
MSGDARDTIRFILFGSRAREDWRPDSDYDVLVVVPRKDRRIVDGLYDGVMDVLLETGILISLKVFDEKRFERLKSIPTPFMANVMAEGVEIGLDE